ncbi:hypothetical protein ACIF8T_40040 [Streptomyces sp. NPDC085946]|uniref:hypothetical protein n=1 Tax=Streptomyces sp. NPDC085946 TaxID=3365744 RepID=UPI0037D418CC
MTGEDAVGRLFAEVCGTLARAGFDVAAAGREDAPGLWVRKGNDAVGVSWAPSTEDPLGQKAAESEGVRAALRQALLEILTQAGYTVQLDRAAGEVRVLPPHGDLFPASG